MGSALDGLSALVALAGGAAGGYAKKQDEDYQRGMDRQKMIRQAALDEDARKARNEDNALRQLEFGQRTGITPVRRSTPLEAGGSAIPDLPTIQPPDSPVSALKAMVGGGAPPAAGPTMPWMQQGANAAPAAPPEPPMAALGRLSGMVGDTPQGPKWRGPGGAGLSPDTPITSNILGDFAKTGPSHEERTYAQQDKLVTDRAAAAQKLADQKAKEAEAKDKAGVIALFGNHPVYGPQVKHVLDQESAGVPVSWSGIRQSLTGIQTGADAAHAADVRANSGQAAQDRRTWTKVQRTMPDGEHTFLVNPVNKEEMDQGLTPQKGGATAAGTNARLATAVAEVQQAEARMRKFEDDALANPSRLNVIKAFMRGKANEKGGLGAATDAAIAHMDPEYAQYLRDRKAVAEASRLIAARGGSDAMLQMDERLAGVDVADAGMIEAARTRRAKLFGRGSAILKALPPEMRPDGQKQVPDADADYKAWVAAGRPLKWPP